MVTSIDILWLGVQNAWDKYNLQLVKNFDGLMSFREINECCNEYSSGP